MAFLYIQLHTNVIHMTYIIITERPILASTHLAIEKHLLYYIQHELKKHRSYERYSKR